MRISLAGRSGRAATRWALPGGVNRQQADQV